MEMYDKSLEYTPFGFADIWKGNYRGEPVCIKSLWTLSQASRPGETQKIYDYFLYQKLSEHDFYNTYATRKFISHPNLLPIINKSGTPYLTCIMSPWMPDGNITQYTQINPGVNRLMLVRAHQPEARKQPTDPVGNSLHKRASASYIFMGTVSRTVTSIQ
jgi:hypothetical protein